MPPVAPVLTDEQFSQLLEVLGQRQATDPSLVKAITDLASAQSRTTRQSNAAHPETSAFSHPEGNVAHPKAKLARETWFCGVRQDEDQLTPSEIDLFNAITGPKSSRNGAWWAKFDQANGAMHVYVPHASIDDRMVLPNGLALILLELQGGVDMVEPTRLVEEVMKLREQVANLAAMRGIDPTSLTKPAA